MASRRPLVVLSGLLAELPSGDVALAGTSATEIIAGSGLDGGNFLSSTPRLDVDLVDNASGLIFVDDKLANDGVALANATSAAASGNDAAVLGSQALSSGNLALSTAVDALASGNEAIAKVDDFTGGGTKLIGTAGAQINKHDFLGFNDAGEIVPIRMQDWDHTRKLVAGPPNLVENDSETDLNLEWDPVRRAHLFSHDNSGSHLTYTYIKYTGARNFYAVGAIKTVGASSIPTIVQPSLAYNKDNDYFMSFFESSSNNDPSFAPAVALHNSVPFSVQEGIDNTYISSTIQTPRGFYLKDNTFIMFYYDGSNSTDAIVFKSNGSKNDSANARAGAPRSVFNRNSAINMDDQDGFFDPVSEKFIWVFRGWNNYIYAMPITIDFEETIITEVGAATQITDYVAEDLNVVWDERNKRAVVAFRGQSDHPVINSIRLQEGGIPVINNSGTWPHDRQMTMQRGGLTHDPYTNTFYLLGRMEQEGDRPGGFAFTPSGEDHFFFNLSGVFTSVPSAIDSLAASYDPENNAVLTVFRSSSEVFAQSVTNYYDGANVTPHVDGFSNFIGVAESAVASGNDVTVLLPGEKYTLDSGNFHKGDFLYMDVVGSGYLTDDYPLAAWSGQIPWQPVAVATSTSGVLLINQL